MTVITSIAGTPLSHLAPKHAWLLGLALLELLLLALPTPFWLLDSALDPRVWDPSTGWPSWQRALLASSKALPLLVAFGACLQVLLRQGIGAPRLLSGSQPDGAAVLGHGD
jgi:hypothetical protein